MTDDIRWKQRFENFARALHQLTLAVGLAQQRPLSDLENYPAFLGLQQAMHSRV